MNIRNADTNIADTWPLSINSFHFHCYLNTVEYLNHLPLFSSAFSRELLYFYQPISTIFIFFAVPYAFKRKAAWVMFADTSYLKKDCTVSSLLIRRHSLHQMSALLSKFTLILRVSHLFRGRSFDIHLLSFTFFISSVTLERRTLLQEQPTIVGWPLYLLTHTI